MSVPTTASTMTPSKMLPHGRRLTIRRFALTAMCPPSAAGTSGSAFWSLVKRAVDLDGVHGQVRDGPLVEHRLVGAVDLHLLERRLEGIAQHGVLLVEG